MISYAECTARERLARLLELLVSTPEFQLR